MFLKIRFADGKVKVLLVVDPLSFENACKVVFQNYKQAIVSIKEIDGFEYNQLAEEYIQLVAE